jgi:putative phage-type endonuclease
MNSKPIQDRIDRVKTAPQYAQRTPEWYEVRRSLMTASVVSSALGIKPFASFTGDVRREAIINAVHRKFQGNVATRHGVKYEDSVREKFDEIMGKTTKEYGLLVHNDIHGPEKGLTWLAASPDGMTEDGELVEIKCPWRRQIVPGEVPHHYLPQIQAQLEVCDLDICYFVEWQPAHLSDTGTEVINIVPVARDHGWLERHYAELRSFYEELMEERRNFVPPPPPNCLVRDDLYNHIVHEPKMMFVDETGDVVRSMFLDED